MSLYKWPSLGLFGGSSSITFPISVKNIVFIYILRFIHFMFCFQFYWNTASYNILLLFFKISVVHEFPFKSFIYSLGLGQKACVPLWVWPFTPITHSFPGSKATLPSPEHAEPSAWTRRALALALASKSPALIFVNEEEGLITGWGRDISELGRGW